MRILHSLLFLILSAGPCGVPARAVAIPPAPRTDAREQPALLTYGSPAPPFRAGTWIKHGPISTLEPGQVYVVEFWATWCVPCREMIPHLTELARKFQGKVTFIGVDVREKPGPAPAVERRVRAFVESMGDRMDYNVCRDTADDGLFEAWLKPSGSQGIPRAFVVDGMGRLAWFGSPTDLGTVLEGVLKGGFDGHAYDAQVKARQQAHMEVYEALRDHQWQRALDLIPALKARDAEEEAYLHFLCFKALLHLDKVKAQAAYEQIQARGGEGARNLPLDLAMEEGLEPAWYAKAAEGIAPLVQTEPMLGQFLAQALARSGNPAAACRAQRIFLRTLKGRLKPSSGLTPTDRRELRLLLRKSRADLVAYEKTLPRPAAPRP